MGFLSILPESLKALETWITRIFLFLGLLAIGPWVALLIYDILLYLFRACVHEIPVVGGRAQGKDRPRAPSLTERPSGRRRKFSLRGFDRPVLSTGGANVDARDARHRRITEVTVGDSS
ncbi:hypothetical protein ACJQWK_04572 [Exserohilum turcicum]|uniref:Uncharacterized protein n=1 Tax=Exserohilum turcicum (strain 28A) TaxID=671987 RepID=R0IC39_EXST2|nr:uncharacterized protein SETTUDRAFT_34316 [Exserohilum turcica Et28A]EOA82786.1 hypothetical protein SETTUDRAFT_34316 [Exserohilum turcica Et28A]